VTEADRQGGNIVKGKVVWGALALIGTLVLSATAAQAGSGGLPSALTSFFACYSLTNTKDSGQTVDLQNADESPIAVPNRNNVRIGNGSLACTIIRMLDSKTQALAEPDPTQLTTAFNGIKCYSVTSPGGSLFAGPSGTFTFTDTIWGTLGTLPDGGSPGGVDTEMGVAISQLKYICGPAIIGQ
jgi:hypothetical protein